MTVIHRDHFDTECLDILEQAEGFAELTGFQQLYPSHLFMALASQENGYLDGLLRDKFEDLRAATVSASLKEILEIAAPGDAQPGASADNFGSLACTRKTKSVLERAGELSRAWGGAKVNPQALTAAILAEAEDFLLDAFSDAGVDDAALSALAAEIAAGAPAVQEALQVFAADAIRLESFGAMARRIFRALAHRPGDRPLVADDLLAAVLEQEDARTVEALHVMGLRPDTMLAALNSKRGDPPQDRGARLEVRRLGRLLRGIVESSAELARRERCGLIGESQLVRAHLDRVGGSDVNVFQRFGINPIRLRSYLESYKTDREAAQAEAPTIATQDIEGFLKDRVLGQEGAIGAVLPALKRMRTGVNHPGRLMGVFLFLGATGVGKTELAKAIADVAFPAKKGVRDPYLIRIDCGNLASEHDIVRLIGAAQGLVGYKQGALTNGLRDKGQKCVILFDEAEKAHPLIWQGMLNFFGEGIVTEADGTLYDATGCILIATSNLGYKDATEKFHLLDLSPEQLTDVRPKVEDFIWSHVVGYFSPEFRGRFGRENVLFFDHFRREHYQRMLSTQLAAVQAEMLQREFEIEIDPAIAAMLVDLAWDGRMDGARHIERMVSTHVRTPIADAIADDPTPRAIQVPVSDQLKALVEARSRKQTKAETPGRDLEGFLKKRVVNQEAAVKAVVPALKRMRAGLNEPGRVMGVYLFLGATGVGKTELARAIAEAAFGAEEGNRDAHLILINCGVLKEPRDIVQLLGAPQGLKGYKEGALTNGLRDKSGRCVVLFDEAEKADPQIWQSLLQLFDEGIVLEADGTRHDATGCVLVATSNLGYGEALEKFRVFDRPAGEAIELQPRIEEFVWTKVTEYFSPEFRGRFGRENVIFFNHFTLSSYRTMIEGQGGALIAEMARRAIALTIDPQVFDSLAQIAWSKRNEGARPVRRLVTAHVRDVVVEARSNDPDLTAVHVSVTAALHHEVTALETAERERSVFDIERYLNARVIRQERAVRAIVPAVKRMRAGMNEAGRLLGSFLFLGPSGVGKTELAKGIGDAAFGAKPGVKDPYLIRIDCGKLTSRNDIVQLLGAPQGLVGYKEGALTNGLRDKGGRCIILFDEAEKADPQIWQSLLTFFDEGIVTEADGTRYDATGCILIATSNLGYAAAIESYRLFEISAEDAENLRPQIETFIWNKVREYFSPEFLGRFGRENVILFNHFDKKSYSAIIDAQREQIVKELGVRGFNVTVDEKAVQALTEMAWEKRAEGARTVRRLLTTNIRDRIVDELDNDPQRTDFGFSAENGAVTLR